MDELSVRRARSDDLETLLALTGRSMAYWPHDAAYLAEANRLMSLSVQDLARDEAWVVERNGKTIGYYRLTLHVDLAEIEELFVEPAWIGRGIGRKLFEHAVARARRRGCARLEWDTHPDAAGFYLAMGGREIGARASGIAGGEPLTRMRFDL
jgi:GNAT superfamily N-acetyltransferase